MHYVVDTSIFNKLLDGVVTVVQLPADGDFLATHIQIDEINNTGDRERRARLLLVLAELRPRLIPTESMVWDVSRWDHAKFDGAAYDQLKTDLDALNKGKSNNAHDALIAEVALVNGHTLLTADADLAKVVGKHGGKVVFYET